MHLDAELDLKEIVKSENVAELLSAEDRAKIARQVQAEFRLDEASRSEWEARMKTALELALQVVQAKTFPWPDAANVKFPLITIAALQFHARAYPAMIPGPDLVKCRVFGDDADGRKVARASRVATHMSYQILEEDEAWEDNHDRVLITVPIVGCAFKKTYFDPARGHNVSENCLAKDIYIPYFAKSLETASRVTHVLEVSGNTILANERQGLFSPHDSTLPPIFEGLSNPLEAAKSQAQGITPATDDPEVPFQLLEQHRWLDLDGDGFDEPYIVTVQKDTPHLCRIVARFTSTAIKRNRKGEIFSIKATNHFTKYPFIPSPDGGIYDLGFGALLGPLNASINTLINQLLDSGTLSNTAGGFLGRGAKFRSGDNSFRPFEWKRVDCTGDDLRKNLIPYEPKAPSQVLFALLELLINYGERVAGATDPQVGINPGQNTPAETSRNTIAEGQRVFLGIFKRLHRAMKEEFRKLYLLNQVYLEDETSYYSGASDIPMKVLREDYFPDEKTICPTADPNMVSDAQKMFQAQFLKEASLTTAGYDRTYVERKFLEALKVQDPEKVFPGPDKMPPPQNPTLEIERMKMEAKTQELQMKMRLAALELLGEAEVNQAKIQELRAKSVLHLAEARGVESGHAIALIQSQIGAAKQHQEGLLKAAKLIMDGVQASKEKDNGSEGNALARGVASLAGASSDPALQGVPGGAGGVEPAGMV